MWRPLIQACLLAVALLAAASPAAAQLKSTLFTGGLIGPVAFVQDPTDPTVQMVVEKRGIVWAVRNGVVQTPAFLDLSAPGIVSTGGEQGLLGLAFSPDYATSRRFYVSFTNANGHSVISRFLRTPGNPLLADSTTRFDFQWPGGLTHIVHPGPTSTTVFGNHNGGNIAFGPDGYFYVGLGDGGSGNDPFHLAQNPMSLLGKMLRLNVAVSLSDPEGYDIPPTNPFVGQPTIHGEIWSFGLRNPWRWSFDWPRAGGTGALVIADVGQGAREEVNYEPMGAGGRNYGWRNREGTLPNVNTLPAFSAPLREPIWDYDRTTGRSITGGFVYRGNALGSAYRGRYFFADFATSHVWSVSLTIDPVTKEATAGGLIDHTAELGAAAVSVSSFGVDAYGEIYIVAYGGAVYRIDPLNAPAPGSCAASDPYVSAGGGTCLNGTWRSRSRDTDFNANQAPDLLFENSSSQLYAWFMAGKTFAGGDWLTPGQIEPNRLIVGTGDFSGDGRADLVVQHQLTGALAFFIMNGIVRTSEQLWPLATNSPWRVVNTGDFDGDGHVDILWTNPSTGQFYVWFMQPSGGLPGYGGPGGLFRGGFVQDQTLTPVSLGGSAWRVVGSGDFNGDNKSDLVWQNESTGDLSLWLMDGLVAAPGVSLTPSRVSTSWKIVAVGDYNLDQHPDLIWQQPGSGALHVWFMVGPKMASDSPLSPGSVGPTWQIVGPQ